MTKAESVDAYIRAQTFAAQKVLKQVRSTIRKAAPHATEGVAYGMPGYKLHGKPLVYFAAWKKHIGFYALPSGNAAFKKELAAYTMAKGSIQFPYTKKMPPALIARMVRYRVKENAARATSVKKKPL